jgi:hypothetical protein
MPRRTSAPRQELRKRLGAGDGPFELEARARDVTGRTPVA